ncbi:MAG: beta-ketothiolase BktB [Rhodospirillales bacterium]|nr:beta-ketothiolase BktB [Rhodospirillales bacterium]
MREVVLLSGVRTAIGDYGGALKDLPPNELGAIAIREAVSRSQLEPGQIGHVVFGNVIHTEPKDMYISRVAAVKAGLPHETPALTLNRLCGSAMQAIISASQMIMLGDCDAAVAGGAEVMSRSGYMVPAMRWGQRMGDGAMLDSMVGALTDPFGAGHMGITAENLASQYGITRQEQDAFAVESHRRAAAAVAAGYFKDQIVPVELKTRKGVTLFDTDEHVRSDIDADGLGKLRPAFLKDGTVTAGNASSLNDAAAAVVVMDAKEAEKKGLKPLARILGYALSGVDPKIMGIGPVSAVQMVLKKTGVTLADIDVIESNEAFAAQACAVARGLDLPADRTNPNGGAIALGHPIGATGAIITVKAAYEMNRRGGKYALATMCIGGGQGIALLLGKA